MKKDYLVQELCEAFAVSRSGYYDWQQRQSTPGSRATEDARTGGEEPPTRTAALVRHG